MARLPRDLGGGTVVKALSKAGYRVARQKGSHIALVRDADKRVVVVPDHRPLKVGTLSGIIKQAGLSVEEFIALLD